MGYSNRSSIKISISFRQYCEKRYKTMQNIWHLWDRALLERRCKQPTRCNDFRLSIFYWSIWISSTCFGQQTRQSSGVRFDCMCSFWFNAPLLLPPSDKVEMELSPSQPCHQSAAISAHCTRALYTVKKCSWGLASLSPKTSRADSNRSIKRSINENCCILLVAYIVMLNILEYYRTVLI